MPKAADILKKLQNEVSRLNNVNETNIKTINLTNLRDLTNGDKTRETELFKLFKNTAKECLDILKQSIKDNNHTNWENASHRLKGASANLGAEKLAYICQNAGEYIDINEKKSIIEDMCKEYRLVIKELDS